MDQAAMDIERTAKTVWRFAEATNLSLISINCDGDIEFVNPSACALFGYGKEEMVGRPITIIIPERMRGAHMAGLSRVATGESPNLGGRAVEVSAVRKDGTEFPIEITLSVWQGEQGVCAGAIIRDISERREREARLMRLASHDTLTGLANRHQFMSVVGEKLQTVHAGTVVVIDLDGFKEVNDTHGHPVGDSLLQAVGVRLSYLFCPDTSVARLGGDEFAVLLPSGDPLEAQSEATRILGAFRKPFALGPLVLELSASVGIALAPSHGTDAEELLASADFALYRAKAVPGACYRMFDHSMRSEAQARRATRDELRRALREGQLVMQYQPQVYMESREIIGFEALIRWRHPERGLLSPAAFLPALEQSALALEIGWWTLGEACRTASRLNANGGSAKISVNLFPTQFRALNLCDRVQDSMDEHGTKPGWLELEVTEQVALMDDEKALRTLTALRDKGVGVAFDDFGTGFASLSSLQRFPITTLKIDRGFVRELGSSVSDAAITKALICMSKDMGLNAIAEGIETEIQEQTLLAMGCPCGQGYRYGRPMDEDDIYGLVGSAQVARRA